MHYRIDFLHNHSTEIPEIAQCFYKEWGHFHPDKTLEDIENLLKERINEDKIPLGLIAINEQKKFIGSVSLKETDFEMRRDISP